MPVNSMASATALSMAASSAAAAHELGARVAARQERLAAHGHVLPHGQRVEQLGPLERSTESEA